MRNLENADIGLLWISLSEPFSCEKRHKLRIYLQFNEDAFDEFEEYRPELIELVGEDTVSRLNLNHDRDKIEGFVEENIKKGVEIVTYNDDRYPEQLRNVEFPPVTLYCKGDISLFDMTCIAVVGSRDATDYGIMAAKKFVAEFAKCGLCVVSGIARGIDTVAHRTSLDNAGKTIAVLPCGQDVVYPADYTITLHERELFYASA